MGLLFRRHIPDRPFQHASTGLIRSPCECHDEHHLIIASKSKLPFLLCAMPPLIPAYCRFASFRLKRLFRDRRRSRIYSNARYAIRQSYGRAGDTGIFPICPPPDATVVKCRYSRFCVLEKKILELISAILKLLFSLLSIDDFLNHI